MLAFFAAAFLSFAGFCVCAYSDYMEGKPHAASGDLGMRDLIFDGLEVVGLMNSCARFKFDEVIITHDIIL